MNTSTLATKSCSECRNATSPLPDENAKALLRELPQGWNISGVGHLERQYKFKDFKEALAFTNRVGTLAEAEGHHPDILLQWGKVKVELYTHKVNGLTESDFILAAKITEPEK